MKIKVIRIYSFDDPEMIGEELMVQLFVYDKLVLEGDYYHDKIDSKIEGFLEALDYLGVYYTQEEESKIDLEKQFS